MPFQLKIFKNDKAVYATSEDGRSLVQIRSLLQELDAEFPEAGGFRLTIHRLGSTHPGVDRKAFQSALSKNDFAQLFQMFFVQEEFRLFVLGKQRYKFDELPQGDEFDFLENYSNVAYVLRYKPGYCRLERTGTNFKYLLASYLQPESNQIEELELRLYLCYLSDGDYG